MHTLDISIESLTKVEGGAALDINVKDSKVTNIDFKITESKRFFTQSIEGKPVIAVPQLLARVCGTCSNAHLLCSIEACERALGITPSKQTMMLRHLTINGLNIRDHALHLYLFVMPDLYNKDSFLDFDEDNEEQHQHLHDAFEIKAVGNYLANIIAGRSVHALYPTIGGFNHYPAEDEVAEAIKKMKDARPAVLRLIKRFIDTPWHLDRKTNYMGLVTAGEYTYLEGVIMDKEGKTIQEEDYRDHLEHVVLPYSTASAYKYTGDSYMVGALARMNLEKQYLRPETKADIGDLYDHFPSTNIYDNNLAQAIEILQSIDQSIHLLENNKIEPEEIIKKTPTEPCVGIGVIEAPRGLLYHKVELNEKGIVTKGEIVVPTGQNQINIEEDVARLVEGLLDTKNKDEIEHEIEILIRAYDPCMSCAAHFLKFKWLEE